MMQYFLTALAVLAVLLVGYRVWSSREPAGDETAGTPPATTARADGLPPVVARRLLFGAGALVVLAAALFAFRSPPNADDGASAAMTTPQASGSKAIDDVDTMIERLAQRLEKEPGDGEGFRMLGWSYLMTGHPEKAIEPYKRALALLPGKANVQAGYGEALVGSNGNKVTPEAKAAFDKALALDPAEPRATYFLALWQAQNGNASAALDSWIKLANGAAPDAPWLADVQARIRETSAKLGVDVSARLKSAPSSAADGYGADHRRRGSSGCQPDAVGRPAENDRRDGRRSRGETQKQSGRCRRLGPVAALAHGTESGRSGRKRA